MSLLLTQIEIPTETVELLGRNAAARRLPLTEYLRVVAENDRPPQSLTFDEILAPFSAEVEASSITDEELDDLIQTARREVYVETKEPETKPRRSFLQTARSLELEGPTDWSTRIEEYLYGENADAA